MNQRVSKLSENMAKIMTQFNPEHYASSGGANTAPLLRPSTGMTLLAPQSASQSNLLIDKKRASNDGGKNLAVRTSETLSSLGRALKKAKALKEGSNKVSGHSEFSPSGVSKGSAESSERKPGFRVKVVQKAKNEYYGDEGQRNSA